MAFKYGKKDLRLAGRIFRYAFPYWKTILLVMGLVGIYSLGLGARAFIGKLLFDDVLVEKSAAVSFEGAERITISFAEETEVEKDLPGHFLDRFRKKTSRAFEGGEVTVRRGEQTIGPFTYLTATVEATAFERRDDGAILARDASIDAEIPRSATATASSAVQNWAALEFLLIFGVIVSIVIAVSHYFQKYLNSTLEAEILADIRVDTASNLIRQPLGYFDDQRQGELMSRLTNDVSRTNAAVSLIFGKIFQYPIVLLTSIAVAIYISWELSLILFVVLPVITIPVVQLGKKIRKASRRSLENAADLTTLVQQAVGGIRDLKALGLEDHRDEHYREENERYVDIIRSYAGAKALTKAFLEFTYNAGSVALLVVGAWVISSGLLALTVGDLVAFAAVIVQMYMPAKGLAKAYQKLQEALAGAERVFEIHDLPGEPPDPPDARAFTGIEDAIRFEDVRFAYREGEEVLRGISFEAPAGEVTALVGPTGAGKSTIANLILRFYDPDEGRVTVDGTDLRDLSRESLLDGSAIVSQDPFLFHLSIRENIALGKLGATEEEVRRAAEAAHVAEEIESFEDGYDTIVGDRGTSLSGGQRQRVTIARALLRNAPLLILDEATSSLDAAKEADVKEALDALMADRTTIVIAHRLSTIRDADRILVLEDGLIRERGTHAELLAEDGLYATLYEMQVGEAEAAVAAESGA